jgi:hypothetical protein
MALAALALDVEAQHPQRSKFGPESLGRVAHDIGINHVDFNLAKEEREIFYIKET